MLENKLSRITIATIIHRSIRLRMEFICGTNKTMFPTKISEIKSKSIVPIDRKWLLMKEPLPFPVKMIQICILFLPLSKIQGKSKKHNSIIKEKRCKLYQYTNSLSHKPPMKTIDSRRPLNDKIHENTCTTSNLRFL